MKQLLFSLFFVIFLYSCQDLKNERQEKAIENKISSELAKEERNDTIFLDFYFGMTETELEAHLKKLKRQGKIYLNEKNSYEYLFDFGESGFPKQGKGTFSAEYYNDLLYKFYISVKTDDGVAYNDLLQMKFPIIFMSKYGNPLERENYMSEIVPEYIWVNGNRMIEITQGIDDVRIIYTDLIAEKEMYAHRQVEKNEKAKDIQEDI